MSAIEQMRFHGPGWTLTVDGEQYQVWAPQDGVIADPFNGVDADRNRTDNPGWKPRAHWAAHWQHLGPDDDDEWEPNPRHPGGYWRGASAAEVLAHFPAAIRQRFAAVINSPSVL